MLTRRQVCSLLLSTWSVATVAIENGDSICAEGYIMDNYCIDRTFLFDNNRLKTLEHPDRHTVHCLVDVKDCRDSGFAVLTDPAPGERFYTIGWQLNAAGTQRLIELARRIGDCGTCDGDGDLEEGMRAAIRGTVVNANVNPPVIRVDSVQYIDAETVFCPAEVTTDPTLAPGTKSNRAPTMEPTRVPTLALTTRSPNREPTRIPTAQPSYVYAPPAPLPSETPTTKIPSSTPTSKPVSTPSLRPTSKPTPVSTNNDPTYGPPTLTPTTDSPSLAPIASPTVLPSFSPTIKATNDMAAGPQLRTPSGTAAAVPTPTLNTTMHQTEPPSAAPTAAPTHAPKPNTTSTPTASPVASLDKTTVAPTLGFNVTMNATEEPSVSPVIEEPTPTANPIATQPSSLTSSSSIVVANDFLTPAGPSIWMVVLGIFEIYVI